MSGLGGDSKYACKAPEGVACDSVSGTYANPNPYLYMASQIICGLDGLKQKSDPGQSADTPYEVKAPMLPRSLAEALAALDADKALRAGLGDFFVDYYVKLKQAEIDRFSAGGADWEQREYFSVF